MALRRVVNKNLEVFASSARKINAMVIVKFCGVKTEKKCPGPGNSLNHEHIDFFSKKIETQIEVTVTVHF